MIEWILHRPPHASNAAEIRVAEKLKALENSTHRWTVIWGYYYCDQHGVQREGDFLILGPAGGALVLEVKSSLPRHFPETGCWEGGVDDPIKQLNAEWQGVIHGVKKKGKVPYIGKVLCVPYEYAESEMKFYQGIDRSWLVTGNDLDNWLTTWYRIFGNRVSNPVSLEEKNALIEAFGQGSLPEEKRAFVNHTEELFERQFTARFSLLDQLAENRQLLVRGGTGTGKTWHALELAFRYARQDGGQRVLFLTYNKALTAQLRRIVSLRQLECGRVEVWGWEELFLSLCTLAGVPLAPPRVGSAGDVTRQFYEIDLPLRVLEASRDAGQRKSWPVFDALIVDEGQDHDTRWADGINPLADESGGWWHVYQILLRKGRDASAGIFYDAAQRPPFRAAEAFDSKVLVSAWSQPAHVCLQPAVRYTRPVWKYICDHPSPATAGMIESLGNGDHLPEGPDPEVHTLTADGSAAELIESILTHWRRSGLCDPSDVLILHAQSNIMSSPLGDRRVIGGRNLRECIEQEDEPGCIRHTSVHKAKGLDAKAVILIGMKPHQELVTDYDHYSWFMAVSRARQLLAIVESV